MKGSVSGLIVAPLVPACIVAIWAFAKADLEAAGILFPVVAIFGYMSELLVGLPLLKWVMTRGCSRLSSALVIGGFSPVPLLTAVSALGPAPRGITRLEGYLNLLTLAVPLGVIAGLTLWFVTYRTSKMRAAPWA
jgi:hypothetical protein